MCCDASSTFTGIECDLYAKWEKIYEKEREMNIFSTYGLNEWSYSRFFRVYTYCILFCFHYKSLFCVCIVSFRCFCLGWFHFVQWSSLCICFCFSTILFFAIWKCLLLFWYLEDHKLHQSIVLSFWHVQKLKKLKRKINVAHLLGFSSHRSDIFKNISI